jgi:drug/metabolite transporter (DMT)-like permease
MVKLPSARWAAAALLLNALVWGLSWWPFRTLQEQGLHPLWATALVYWFALACVLACRPHALHSSLRWPGLLWLALASGLTNICFNWAVTVGDVVRVVLLFYLMPAWAVLLAWPILGEKPSAMALVRLGLALVGVLLVLQQPESRFPLPHGLADYLALAGGMCFALTTIMLRKLRESPNEARMVGMFGGGALMATLLALWGWHAQWLPGLPAVHSTWLLLALGLALAFLVGNLALQLGAAQLRSATTSLIMLSEIVFATLSSVLLGAASLELRTIVGGALILAAAAWAAWADGASAG